MKKIFSLIAFLISQGVSAKTLQWGADGISCYQIESGRYIPKAITKTSFVSQTDRTSSDQSTCLTICHFYFI